MKKFLFLMIANLCWLAIYSQTNPASLQWERSQNGSASLSHYIVKILTDVSGNVYTLSSADGDMVVVKFNSSTGVTQSYIYNNQVNAGDYPKDFTYDAAGNIYIVGNSFNSSTWGYEITVVKFNAAGSLAWQINYRSSSWVYPTEVSANAVALDASNNIYITGSINDSLMVAKISNSGTIQMVKHITIASTDLGSGQDIALDASGNMYVAGKTNITTGNYDAVAFKLNSTGVVQWTKQISGFAGTDDNSFNIGVDNSSNSYVLSNIADTSASNFTPYLTKYNASGAQQFQKKLHVPGQINSEGVELVVDNIGNTYSAIHVNTSASDGYTRVVKHSSSGTLAYDNAIDIVATADDKVSDIYLDVNNNLFVVGQSGGSSFCSKINTGGAIVFSSTITGSSISAYSPVCVVADASGFINVVGTYYKIINSRLNNTGIFQFEGVFAGEANTYDRATRVFTHGNHAVYSYGYLTNDNSQADAVLSKYDTDGNLQWQNMIDVSNGYDDSFDMDHDTDYNIYISKNLSLGSEVVKYDSAGSPVWYNTSFYRYKKMKADNGGTTYLAGNEGAGSSAYASFHIKKIDASGVTIYETIAPLATNYVVYLGAMTTDVTNRIYAAGTRVLNPGTANPITRVIVQKFSVTGNQLWIKELTLIDSTSSYASFSTAVNKVLVDASNNVYVMGIGYNAAGFGQSYSYVTKFDNNGTQLWQQLFTHNGSSEDSGTMEFVSNNEIVMFTAGAGKYIIRRINRNDGLPIFENPYYLGNSNGATVIKVDASENFYCFGEALGNSNISRDLYLLKIDLGGNLIWYTTKAGSRIGNDYARDMDITPSGRIYLLAEMLNSNGSQSDLSLLKYCDIPKPSISTPNNFTALCPGNNVTITANGGSVYLWSPGNETTNQITVNTANDYYATVSQYDGCYKNTDTIHLTIKAVPATPQICLVTVDTASTHNILVWDKTGFTGVDSIEIYREDVTNIYSHIGTVPNDSLSEYHDFGANPNMTSKRYKISASDSCGQESVKSNYHNTIFIVDNGTGTFAWNPLYTIENSANPVSNYVLKRDDNNTGNWTQVAITAGSQNTLADPDYTTYPNGKWYVETVWSISCTPTRATINTTRSNIKGVTVSTGAENALSSSISVYPNPAKDNIAVEFQMLLKNTQLKIIDVLGQTVYVDYIMASSTKVVKQINTGNFSKGVYTIVVEGEKEKVFKKLVIN